MGKQSVQGKAAGRMSVWSTALAWGTGEGYPRGLSRGRVEGVSQCVARHDADAAALDHQHRAMGGGRYICTSVFASV